MNKFIDDGIAYLWNMEFDDMRWKLRAALQLMDDPSRSADAQGYIKQVIDSLNNMYEATQGETK